MINVILNQTSIQPHTNMIVVGLEKLKKEGLINLSINDCRTNKDIDKNIAITELIIDGKRVIIDVGDGYSDVGEAKKNLLEHCDFYFKRSFNREYNKIYFEKNLDKIYPLGLNYYVYGDKIFFDFEKRNKKQKIIRNMLGFKSDTWFKVEKFESNPTYKSGKPKILFYSRLWKPSEEPWAVNNKAMNECRINIIRELRKRYGSNFIGGIYEDEYSKSMCPDIIVSKLKTKKENFLRNIKKSDICIGTSGLDESIGWKTAEYVAASKSIVLEKPKYELPGNFDKDVNYLEFTNLDECLKQIEYLVNEPQKIIEMQKQNKMYYDKYVRPDAEMKNVIRIVNENK